MPKRAAAVLPEAEIIASLLAKLDDAGMAGLTQRALVGKASRTSEAREGALQRLEKSGLAVVLHGARSSQWYAARHAPSVAMAVDWLRVQGPQKGLMVWRADDFKKFLPKALRVFASQALASLMEAGEMWELRAYSGKARFWVFANAMNPLKPGRVATKLGESPSLELAPTQRFVVVGPAARAAYERWKQTSGSSLMAISDLQSEANVPLRALHDWLLDEAQAHRAELSEGDWSLASEEMRSACLRAQGMQFIRVRLQECR
ncbi:MAG: hypothetical protein ACOYMN_04275 [Roseimicrobium sp.]